MAWFQIPNNATDGDYSVVSPAEVAAKNLVPNSVWKVTVPLGGSAHIWFVDGAGLNLTSNAPMVVANPLQETSAGNIRIVEIKGAALGFTLIYASTRPGNGSMPLQVEVVASPARPTLKSGITLYEPTMALNSWDTPLTYDMKFNAVISSGTAAKDVIDQVKSKGALNHLAISCHGFVSPTTGATRLELGSGFDSSNTGLFSAIKYTVSVIWIGGCAAAGSTPGSNDCAKRAQEASCYLVAAGSSMSNPPGSKGKVHLGKGVMDMNPAFLPVVFSPLGLKVPWTSFLGLSSRLHFKVF